MDVQDHVAGAISDSRVGMSRGVVEELDYSLGGFFGGLRLGCGNGASCDEHGWIDG